MQRHHAWIAVALLLTGCAYSAYPNATMEMAARPPVAVSQVQVLTRWPPPGSYAELARVYAWSPIPVDTRAGYDYAVRDLRRRAASIGADGLMVPDPSMLGSPDVQARWMWPVSGGGWRGRDEQRPSELMGIAIVQH